MSVYQPSLAEVSELAQEGNLIAIHRELPADLETPVSVYLKLREQNAGPSFLLESVEKGEIVGRYSFIGVHHPLTVTAWGDQITIGAAGGAVLETTQQDPFEAVKDLVSGRTPVKLPGLPSFTGGAVGYFAYDTVRFIETLPETATTDVHLPDIAMMFCDNLVVFDHVRHRLIVIANMRTEDDLRAAYADAIARIDKIVDLLRKPLTPPQSRECRSGAQWRSNFTQAEHEANVMAAKEYIAAGDIFQVVCG